LRDPLPLQKTSGTEPQWKAPVVSGAFGQIEQVLADGLFDGNTRDGLLQLHDLIPMEHRLSFEIFGCLSAARQQLQLACSVGISNLELHRESIELSFGKRIRPDALDRILRGQNKERLAKAVGLSVDCHLPLGHGLEQGALGTRSRAVDFVGKQYIGKDWAGSKLELAGLLIQNTKSGDIARKQIRRALYPHELTPYGFG
jgi:hypothetical protein